MDPANLFFENKNEIIRVDPSDARFVDVIHSNSGQASQGNFGIEMRSGYMDFFVNGGKSQRGCDQVSPGPALKDPLSNVGCSHRRSIE